MLVLSRACLCIAVCAVAFGSAHAQPRAESDEADVQELDAPVLDLSEVGAAVDRLATDARTRAFAALAQKDYPAALTALRKAHEIEPQDVEVLQKLAHLHRVLGDRGEAERMQRETLRLAPEHVEARLELADLLMLEDADLERLGEASVLLREARNRSGNRADIVLRQARCAAALGRPDEAERLYREVQALTPPSGALWLELGDFYRQQGRDERALEHFGRVQPGDPLFDQAARHTFELEVQREARSLGLRDPGARPPEQAVQQVERARQLLANGRVDEAQSSAAQAVQLAPGYGRARVELGRALAEGGSPDAAELQFLRALALDSGLIDAYTSLAELYLKRADDTLAAEAALLVERALNQRPDRRELHLLAASARRRAGDLAHALAHVDRFLARVAEPAGHADALALQGELRELLGAADPTSHAPLAPEQAAATGVQAALQRARAHLTRGETDSALAVLARVPNAAHSPAVLNLQGGIYAASGRLPEARAALRASLANEADQPETLLRLSRVLQELGLGAEARGRLLQAERLDSQQARLELARLDAARAPDELELWADLHDVLGLLHVRSRLSALLQAAPEPELRAAASALMAEVGVRIWRVAGVSMACTLLLLGVGWWWRRRVHGGASIAELLEREPEVGAEVQRVLSAIRHEVLKHNTLMLRGLVDVLVADAMPGDHGLHAERALFGTADAPGAAQRLAQYVAELEHIARGRGVRLNLRRRDPALSALLAGFAQLEQLRPELSSCGAAAVATRRRLATRLARALDQILDDGATQLDALLDRVRLLQVTRELLCEVFDRVRREPALVQQAIAELAVDPDAALPCTLAMPGPAFEDVLSNLMRNAIQASLREPTPRPVVVGLHVQQRLDPITGRADVAILVRDRSHQPLDARALQGGYIERGLGLTADLASRHDGVLELVTGEPGWSKAVTLVLPEHAAQGEGA